MKMELEMLSLQHRKFHYLKIHAETPKVQPTSLDGLVVGVSLADVPAGYYYWAQYKGICPILVDASDTIVVGEPAGKPGTNGTAGAVGLVANDGTDAVWGITWYVATGGEPALIALNLPEF